MSACSSSPVETKQDREVDTTKYKTYSWISQPEAHYLRLDNPRQIDYMTGISKIVRRPEYEEKLKESVNQQLNARGLRETSEVPDFYITFYGKAKDDDWVSTWAGTAPSILNVPLVMYPNFDRLSARNYQEGSLLLVFYDSKTKKPVWTGTMAHVLDEKKLNLAMITSDLSHLVNQFKMSG